MAEKILNPDITEEKVNLPLRMKFINVLGRKKRIFVMDDEDAVVTITVQMLNELTETQMAGNKVKLFDSVKDLKKVKLRINKFKKLLTLEINENIKTALEDRRK